ncbi:MAG: SH3 domain-containing protein [Clostridia bacterium]|nr:SH3 domain-containing protein [Clostridia bacterium]
MTPREMAERLRSREEELSAEYQELARLPGSPGEERLIRQLLNFQRFQVMTLELLCEGVPERFIGFGQVSEDDVNLREGPGGGYPVVERLKRGQPLVLLSTHGYWVEVQVPRGRSGYVFKDYVQQEASL